LHAAIEREFSIVGEALNRLGKEAPAVADQIPERRQIIAFRNILVHGYDAIDDHVVWLRCPPLSRRVERLGPRQRPSKLGSSTNEVRGVSSSME